MGGDSIGFTAGRPHARDYLDGREAEWNSRGYYRHQESPESHQTETTFRKEFKPGPGGEADPGLFDAMAEVLALFGSATP